MVRYSEQFRQDVAALAASSPVAVVARVAGVSASSVRRWVEQFPASAEELTPTEAASEVESDLDRLEELRELYNQARSALAAAEPHQRAALLREARALLGEIDQAGVASAPQAVVTPVDIPPPTAIDEVRRRREERLKNR